MAIHCPHCQSDLDLEPPAQGTDVVCSVCGSSFRVGGDAEATREWRPREQLGKFELLELVGAGSFGSVYKAYDRQLDRTVAIKVPRAGALSTPDECERFLREGRSIAQLRHPSIVAVHEVGENQTTRLLQGMLGSITELKAYSMVELRSMGGGEARRSTVPGFDSTLRHLFPEVEEDPESSRDLAERMLLLKRRLDQALAEAEASAPPSPPEEKRRGWWPFGR